MTKVKKYIGALTDNKAAEDIYSTHPGALSFTQPKNLHVLDKVHWEWEIGNGIECQEQESYE